MKEAVSYFESMRRWKNLNLQVMFYRHTPASNPGLHSHDFYELVLVCSGSARHYMNAEALPIQAGDLILVPPGIVHGYLEPDDLRIYNILFCRDVFETISADLSPLPAFQMMFQVQPNLDSSLRHETGLLSLSGNAFERALEYAEEICRETRLRAPGAETTVRGLFLCLVAHCLRYARLDSESGAGYARQISSVLAMLDQHPEKNWQLSAMAKHAGMSQANFRLHFRRLTGHSPGAFLLDLRLKKAAVMLRAGRLSVGEIAFRTGFHDANYFSRQFHRFSGNSPRDYRRNKENDASRG